jgi:hypothetical protein
MRRRGGACVCVKACGGGEEDLREGSLQFEK